MKSIALLHRIAFSPEFVFCAASCSFLIFFVLLCSRWTSSCQPYSLWCHHWNAYRHWFRTSFSILASLFADPRFGALSVFVFSWWVGWWFLWWLFESFSRFLLCLGGDLCGTKLSIVSSVIYVLMIANELISHRSPILFVGGSWEICKKPSPIVVNYNI